MIWSLYTGNCKVMIVTNRRSVAAACFPSRHNHRILRHKLFIGTQGLMLESQSVGRHRVGTDIASHVLKSFIEAGAAQKRSVLAVSINVKDAFCSVIGFLLL